MDQKSLENVAGFLTGATIPIGVLKGEGILNKSNIKLFPSDSPSSGGHWNALSEMVEKARIR
ncbi:hypothetical protein PSI23_15150 [Xenorhabdus sp. XENO-10]|uniref:Uncharacterized protein n=1 Tax=Xenorhabdus yunnanensis TaxID=3025878 RepID=A0ABT5LHJ7_9GAMM|nr:hypothetical protein [Xenorhabdus yunnanensis]MDC9590587.1 hypothetical protein [Xenorhabdus yunnanensis]